MKIINGVKIAQQIENQIKNDLKKIKKIPCLAIILVGKDRASEIYVQKKKEICQRLGIKCQIYNLITKNTSQDELLKLIVQLNKNPKINGILVQLPLPKKFNKEKVLTSIAPWKDVDGLNPIIKNNISSTTAAIIEIIKRYHIKLKGQKVVLVGYNRHITELLVPYFTKKGATVIICHRETKNLSFFTKKADILIVAVGKPKLIKSKMIKKGVVIIDVGINRHGKKVEGDIDFINIKNKTSLITPVPGGVGPITVVILIKNLIKVARLQM